MQRMEIAWLEDFLAIVESGSFSAATATRHLTQSALSRRIRALEEWVGTPLLYRTTHTVALTPAGDAFRVRAEDILRQLSAGRAEAVELANGAAESLRFASTNALSLVFFPVWLRRLEAEMASHFNIQLVANNMEACERIMLHGDAQFLLCHHHEISPTSLVPQQFRSLQVGQDTLVPISVPVTAGGAAPLFELPGKPDVPLAHLAYRSESGMGRIFASAAPSLPQKPHLQHSFSSHIAKLLVTMALDGRGMAWSPLSLVADDLKSGRLVRAGSESWDIKMEIRIVRPRARQSAAAEQFWKFVEKQASEQQSEN